MLSLSNCQYALTLDERRGTVQSLRAGEKELLSGAQPPVFLLALRDDAGERITLDAESPCTFAAGQKDGEITLTYQNIGDTGTSLTLTVREDGTAFSKWSADVTGTLQLEWLEFPRVTVADTFSDRGGESRILWPYNEGALVTNLDARAQSDFPYREPEYPSHGSYAMYPGMLFAPFLAVLQTAGNLYLAAHDPEPNTRNVDFYRTDSGVQLKMRVYPGIEGGCWSSTGETLLGTFAGDWYAAAELYRTWFEGAKPARYTKIREEKSLPEWYSDSPVVLTYCVRGHYDVDQMTPNALFPYLNAMPLVEKMAQRLHSRIMVVLMHWEGTAPWAPPYVWPPYGGEEALRAFADALHEKGHILGVYCSGFGWTQRSNIDNYNMESVFEEKHLRDVMCLSPRGELPLSRICNDQRYGYDICPASDFLRETITGEAASMAAAGIDYAQLLDQNHGGTPYMCYAKNHGHPPVPGKWESEAAVEILQQAREKTGGRMLFGCESSAAEAFIPELRFSDNRYELNYGSGLAVPLYAYLYHEYTHNFMGNQVCGEGALNCRENKENLLYRLAYSFVAGDLMTLVVNDRGRIQWAWGQTNFSEHYMPEEEPVLELIANLNRWRQGAAYKYLHDGKMLRPLEVKTEKTVPLLVKSGSHQVPPVHTARYQAADGAIGQIVVNYTKAPLEVTIGTKTVTIPALDAVLMEA